MSDDEDDISTADAAELGLKIVEMADRVLAMHGLVPGSEARWGFTMDGSTFDVVVRVASEGSSP